MSELLSMTTNAALLPALLEAYAIKEIFLYITAFPGCSSCGKLASLCTIIRN